jgi:hypothetical protein
MKQRLTVQSWCRVRDKRWSNPPYRDPEDVWPQSFVFERANLGLIGCICGSGGGSQQATFRHTLEAYIEAALRVWTVDQLGTLEERLFRLSEYVQLEFVNATEPFFANHFQGLWVCALTDETGCAIRTHGRQRAYLRRDGVLTQLSEDFTFAREIPKKDLFKTPEFIQNLELSMFGSGQFGVNPRGPSNPIGSSAHFKWRSADVLLLLSACPFNLGERKLDSLLVESLALNETETCAQHLYERIEAFDEPSRDDNNWSWARKG